MDDKELKETLVAIEIAEKNLAVVKKLLEGKTREIIGIFDGEFMITDENKKYQIPPNYASKSLLVVGDKLRFVEEGPQSKFKQVEKVERIESIGVLTKKDGKWAVVTSEGSFWIISASVKHFGGDIGDEVVVILPKEFKKLRAAWAAMKGMVKEGKSKESLPKKLEEQKAKTDKVTQKVVLKTAEEKKETPEIKKSPEKIGKRREEIKKSATSRRKKTSREKTKEDKKEQVVEKMPEKVEKKEVKGEIKVEAEEELR